MFGYAWITACLVLSASKPSSQASVDNQHSLYCRLVTSIKSNDDIRVEMLTEVNHSPYHIFINMNASLRQVDEKFLSVALPAHLAQRNSRFDPRNPLLRTLTKALAPAYLRFGGTAADFLIFSRDSQHPLTVSQNWTEEFPLDSDDMLLTLPKNHTNFTMSADRWDDLNIYCQQSGLELLFDLNVLLRNQTAWDPSNARDLLRYSVAKGYTDHLHLELGNEPNGFHHALNRSLNASQLGRDFLSLKQMLSDDPILASHFSNSLLVGPDVTKPKGRTLEYLREFLDVVKNQLDRVTYHQYYGNSRSATESDFLSAQLLDTLVEQITDAKQTIAASGVTRPVWLGETSSFAGGGVVGMSDAYIAGFMWLDKLGVSAHYGLDVVIRQTLFEGSYGLLSPKDYTPNPDYWLSLLFKRLVGRLVLDVKVSNTAGPRHVRVYAHCTSISSSRYVKGSVTLYALNLRNSSSQLVLDDPRLNQSIKEVYWLTPHGSDGLKSRSVNLNGVQMTMVDDQTFPSLKPLSVPGGQDLIIPKESFGFIVFPEARAPACMSG